MLSERLRTMGTPEMFGSRLQHASSDRTSHLNSAAQKQPRAQEQWKGHMCTSEGVEICLGPYEPSRHAFVRCELRVVAPSRPAS
jgi:hypothetical protein